MMEQCSGSMGLHEKCGIFGLHRVRDAGTLAYYGLHSLQHRGQEACGIAYSDGLKVRAHKGKGLVTEIFNTKIMQEFRDHDDSFNAVGHVLYGNAASSILENVEPIIVRSHQGTFAVVQNGQLTNGHELRYQLELRGSIFQGTSDTEVIAHLIQRANGSMADKITAACQQLKGAFSLIIMTKNTMYAVRDPHGFRPLCIGRLDSGYVISSESCAFEIVNASFMRDIDPGEIIILGKNGFENRRFAAKAPKAICAMEYIYFLRPDSNTDGLNVHATRKSCGAALAKIDVVEADIVVGVPDSSLSAAQGYAEERGLPYEMGLIKNKYIGRTFIQPRQSDRDRGVKMKLSAVQGIVRDKRVILVDDSIVRGTTSRRIVSLLLDAGAKEVHVRIASAPLKNPCYYGIDLHTQKDLIASRLSTAELCEFIGANSLKFLPLETMKEIFRGNICDACVTGNYIVEPPRPLNIVVDEEN